MLDFLKSILQPGHNLYDLLGLVAVCVTLLFLGKWGVLKRQDYAQLLDTHRTAILSTTIPEQAHALGAMGPPAPPKGIGLLLLLIVGALALASAGAAQIARGLDFTPDTRPAGLYGAR